MTCIVGIVHEGRVWLGGDSASSSGDASGDLRRSASPKVFRKGSYLIGFTSSWRMGQVLHYAAPLPDPPTEDLHGFMCSTFIDAVRTALKAGGVARKDSEQEYTGQFLVGVQGRLFVVDGDYQVNEARCRYDAVGAGAQTALGCLYATSTLTPRRRIRLALRAASRFNAWVAPPFLIVRG